jgi:hypothetical protein
VLIQSKRPSDAAQELNSKNSDLERAAPPRATKVDATETKRLPVR